MHGKLWKCCLVTVSGLALLSLPGCGGGAGKARSESDRPAPLELQYEAVSLAPGGQQQIKVQSGKAGTALVKKNAPLTASVSGDMVIVSASRSARKGKYAVTVKGEKTGEASFIVNVGT
jgi:hypothetical protein